MLACTAFDLAQCRGYFTATMTISRYRTRSRAVCFACSAAALPAQSRQRLPPLAATVAAMAVIAVAAVDLELCPPTYNELTN